MPTSEIRASRKRQPHVKHSGGLSDEALLDPVTAVSGSGPAYVFLLAELLEAAALAQGLPRDLARRLARQTVIGAGALLAANSEDAADLRRVGVLRRAEIG